MAAITAFNSIAESTNNVADREDFSVSYEPLFGINCE